MADFWNKMERVFNVGKGLYEKGLDIAIAEKDRRDNQNSNKMRRVEMLATQMQHYSDSELKKIWSTASDERKYAAGYVLKQRGY